jgi:hypothetical protein
MGESNIPKKPIPPQVQIIPKAIASKNILDQQKEINDKLEKQKQQQEFLAKVGTQRNNNKIQIVGLKAMKKNNFTSHNISTNSDHNHDNDL